ncbi:MAG: hypothetical protein KAY96_00690 [Bacteroidia bacterium]|nr:hypothetical protein [Bacteroidia bacterium]
MIPVSVVLFTYLCPQDFINFVSEGDGNQIFQPIERLLKAQFSKYLLLLSLIWGWDQLAAQNEGLIAPYDGWHAYVSHKNITEISGLGDSIYAISDGGVVLYNVGDASIATYTRVNGLSSVDATALLADPVTRRVFIGFKNGMINYLDADGQLHYVTDIHRNEQFTTKGINHFFASEGLLYVATDFGVVVYDILAKETRYAITKVASNTTGIVVRAVTKANGRLWISMGALGVWSSDLSASNLTLPGIWRQESGQLGLPSGSSNYVCATEDVVFAQVADTVFQKRPGQNWTRSNLPVGQYLYLNASNRNVYATLSPSTGVVLYPDSNIISFDNEGIIRCNYIHKFGDMMIGDRFAGLQHLKFGTGLLPAGPAGPRNNQVVDIAAHKGEMYIAPKGRVGSSARSYDKSGIPYFNLHKDGWKINDHRIGTLSVDSVYMDFYRVAIDTLSGRCFVGSWGEGLVELQGGEVVRTYTSANSGLRLGTAGHMVSGLVFDDVGNLWITQGLNNTQLNMLDPQGQWHAFVSPIPLYAFGITVDDLGNKWIINNGSGLVVFNDNYTPEVLSDDRWIAITTAYGRGGLPNGTVNCVVQDHDLQIWIGTSEGVSIMYDPSLLWTNDFQDAACPIIDGYCLFRDQQVNDIAVDGYNRKWIATENGAFLVNLDGTEVLKHFTTENSPLLDDVVQSIAIDQWTGEVYFGTAKGTISYIGDAIEGRANAAELYAYPNPAILDQETAVMIKGMRRYSKVKITTVSGRLVRELDSHGGEVPWDLRDTYGNMVTPGIYLAFVADPDGKGAGITKIAILEKQN